MESPTLASYFERKDGLPLLKVKIKEKEYYMLIDTGTRECKLDKIFYYEMGNSQDMLVGLKTLCSMTMCGHTFKVPIVVEDLGTKEYIGIIGTRFLHKWSMKVDFSINAIYSQKSVTHQEWTLLEFAEIYGPKMQINKELGKCLFASDMGTITDVCIVDVLKGYTAEQISKEKNNLIIKRLESGRLCLCKPWDDVELFTK